MRKILLLLLLLLMVVSNAQIKKDSINNLEEVVIQAIRVKRTDPYVQSNLMKKDIEVRNLGQDIPILLNFLPNVVTTSDAGAGVGYTGIRVRGSDATRVNVTINGVPVNDSESHGVFWVNMPDFASSTESMQLQRGVGTSTNGSGAFGAGLNLMTTGFKDKSSVKLQNSFGSFNTHKHNIIFNTGTIREYFSFSGRASLIKSDGYVDRASSDLKSFFVSGAYKCNNTLLKVLTFGGHEVTYQSWYGVDKTLFEENSTFNYSGAIFGKDGNIVDYYDNQVDDYTQTHYQLHINHKLNAYWNLAGALHYTKGKGFYEEYHQNQPFANYGLEPILIGTEVVDSTDLIRQKWLDNDFYGLTFSAKYDNNEDLNFIIGGGGNHYDGDHFGNVIWARYSSQLEKNHKYYNNNGFKVDYNLYSKLSVKLAQSFSVFGDLQLRYIDYKTKRFLTSDVDEQWTFFNPKVGATYFINSNNQLYTSLAVAHREPNRSDFKDAAKKPKPEVVNDYELGWRYQKNNIVVDANAYFMYYKDPLILTGKLDDVGGFIRENTDESYRLGVELSAQLIVSKYLDWSPNMAISKNENIDYYIESTKETENTIISYSPSLVLSNQLVFHPIKKIDFIVLSKYVGEQYMSNEIADKSTRLDGYFTTDLQLQWRPKVMKSDKLLSMSLLVNNVFNKKYASNGYMYGADAYYFPQARTNFLIGVDLNF